VTYIQLHNGTYCRWPLRVVGLLFSGELTLLLSASVDVSAGESSRSVAFFQSQPLLHFSESGCLKVFCSFLKQVCCRSTFRRCFLYSPPAVGLGHVRWSVAGCDFRDVQSSFLFEPHVMGANFYYRTFLS
jgi:hypothetical protein